MGFQSVFGAGYLYITPPAGAPLLVAALQDISIDFSRDLKQLRGQSQYALEQAPGDAKMDFKASTGRTDPVIWNSVFFGATANTGQTIGSTLEPWVIAGSATTVANSATAVTDLGVYNYTTGKFLQIMTGSPVTTGKYKLTSAGVYNFAPADAGQSVGISYTYTATTGYTINSGNPVVGTQVKFRVDLFNSFNGIAEGITAYCCQASKLGFARKRDDYTLPSFEFSAQDDGTGRVWSFYSTGTN